jgi:DNA-binding protein HU-beta
MTKQEFVDKISAKANMSRRDAAKAVETVLETITETLGSGGEVSFPGFGKFSTRRRAARQGTNPRTGERVHIPAATVPRFSAGSQLKQAVRGSG